MEIEAKADQVLYCRLERMYVPELSRVVFSAERSGIRKFAVSAMVQIGAVRKQGRAPRGALERELEDWLASLKQ